jgi:surface antigen
MQLRGIILFVLLSASQCIFASNLGFLSYSPITFFRGNDEQMMMNNVTETLNTKADGVKSSWKNPQTGTWGFAIADKTIMRNGVTCRTLTVFNDARQVTGEARYQLCKLNGKWVITEN